MLPIAALIKTSRPVNLFVIALTLFVIRNNASGSKELSDIDFYILIVICCLSAAAGNIWNDWKDIKSDTVNKPDKVFVKIVDKNLVYFTIIFLNTSAMLLSLFLSWFVALCTFISIIALLFYSIALKCKPLWGNFVVASLCALVVVLYLVLEWNGMHTHWRLVIGFYAVFAFVTTFIREIIKDIQDVKGDKVANCNTYPVQYGMEAAVNVTLIFVVFLAILLCNFSYYLFSINNYEGMLFSVLILLLFPISILMLLKRFNKETPANFSLLMKGYMLCGIFFLYFL